MQGYKGIVSTLGGKESGIFAGINGWHLGISIYGQVNEAGEDEFKVILNSGSSGALSSRHIGTFTKADLVSSTPAKTRKQP